MKNITTPLRAIRAHCLECSGNHPKEVRLCQIQKCPLFPFRFGKNPNRKGIAPSTTNLNSKSQIQSVNFENTGGLCA